MNERTACLDGMERQCSTWNKITLLGNRVLVVPLKQLAMSTGGIHIPEAFQDDEKRYRVIAVGPGRRLKNGEYKRIECKPGDVVLIAPFQAHVIIDEQDGQLRIFDASAIELVEMSQYESVP